MNENKKINLIRFFDQRFGACTSSHLNPLKEDPWFSSVYTVRQLNKFGLMMWQDDNWPHSRHLPPSLDRFSLHRCPERRKITNLWKKVGEKGNLRFSWATMYTIALKFYLYSDIYFRYDKRTRERERQIEEADLHSRYDLTSRCIFRDILLILTLVQPISLSLSLLPSFPLFLSLSNLVLIAPAT